MGVSYRTAGRDLKTLEQQGWLETQDVRRQFGKHGRHYFPALPDVSGTPLNVPIRSTNGTPILSQSGNGTGGRVADGTNRVANGTNGHRIGTLSVSQKSLSEISNSEGAAPPSPAGEGYAAPTSADLAAIRQLYLVHKYRPHEIWEKHLKLKGFTLAQVQVVTCDLDRRLAGAK